MIILGIESTAHTFGVGIVNHKGKVLANAKSSYSSPEHGMIPNEIAEHHKKVAPTILKQALTQANLTLNQINLLAYSAGPGLDPALWEGYHFVKSLQKKLSIPLVGVNHCCAHLSIGKVFNSLKDPCYLYVSGVNTQIIVQEQGKYKILGETLDTALGNTFDKFGRIIGLGFPAGPQVDSLAQKGKYIELPYTIKGMDMSFSGLLTRATQLWQQKTTYKKLLIKQGKQLPQQSKTTDLNKPISKEDLCKSLQETAFAMCAEVAERAMAHTGKQELLLVGGVGASVRFCQMLTTMCNERNATFFKVPMDLAGDQGAMIAWEGYLRRKTYGDIKVNPHWRTDDV